MERAPKSGEQATPAASASEATAASAERHGAIPHALLQRKIQRRAKQRFTVGQGALPGQDVSDDAVNPDHHGNGQSARLGIGEQIEIIEPTAMYDGGGNWTADIHAGPHQAKPKPGAAEPHPVGGAHEGGLNAGAITQLVLKPKPSDQSNPQGSAPSAPVTCIYVWDIVAGNEHRSGWVPLHAFKDAAKLGGAEHSVAGRIAKQEGADHGAHETRRVVAAHPSDKLKDLFVVADQHSPKANHATDYFGGPTEVPLFLNVPGNKQDPGRFGVADDLMPVGTHFVLDRAVPEAVVRLYHRQSTQATGEHLVFAYGYFKNDAGERRHGWINVAHVGGKVAG